MFSLPSDLDTLCFSLFVRCDEFSSTQDLRAVFVTTELAPFSDGLPEKTGSKRAFVNQVKLFLLEKGLTDGRVLLLPFLDALRGSYPEQEALHGDLNNLYQRVLALTQPIPSAPSLPPPLSLNHHYICYAPRDGGEHAARLHTALQQAGGRPWLDRRDTPAGYDPEARARRPCANAPACCSSSPPPAPTCKARAPANGGARCNSKSPSSPCALRPALTCR